MKSLGPVELQAAVNAMHFYHRIELPDGVVTPGWAPNYPDNYRLPADLSGKRVLDVGTYDGFWAFECLKRGAREVVAIDDFSDTIHAGETRSWTQFELCRDALGYSVDQASCYKMSVYDVNIFFQPQTFDVVLFLGALYHCKHPLLALERLHGVTANGGMLMVESAICDDYSPYKEGGHGEDAMIMEFYPDNQYGTNPTNWWSPSLRCLSTMIRVAGFSEVKAWKIADPEKLSECRGYAHGTKS